MSHRIVFLVDLVQDVAIVIPLIKLLQRETSLPLSVLTSKKFALRDVTKIWNEMLRCACAQSSATLEEFDSEWDVYQNLHNDRGFLVSASESTVGAHAIAHGVFRCAPPSFITVTLQHGFECVGFLHNRAHDQAHGSNVAFAADVVCSWFSRAALKSFSPSQVHKLYVAGPPSLADAGYKATTSWTPPMSRDVRLRGLICENLHSVRLESEDARAEFIQEFHDFLHELHGSSFEISLRAHPAGRFTETRGIALADGVRKSEGALQETLNLGFDFGISAPSTVLFDMINAAIPVAVWRDGENFVDMDNYLGLPCVSRARDWAKFALRSLVDRDALIERQNAFLDEFEIPENVSEKYLQLFTSMV